MKELAPLFNTSVDYLGQLARTGKFAAKKRGQYWYASQEAVEQYFKRQANNHGDDHAERYHSNSE